MENKVIVIDLDGTLLNVNTFHKWFIFLFKKTLFINPIDSLKILFIALRRILKVIEHKDMKYKILKISESKKYTVHVDEFVSTLDIYLNKEVFSYIKEENITILATAAPSLYTQTIAKKYNLNYSICTPPSSQEEWYENIREEKKESLKELLNILNIRKIDRVISDHYDDIPIMEMAEKTLLVNASLKTQNLIRNNKNIRNIELLNS